MSSTADPDAAAIAIRPAVIADAAALTAIAFAAKRFWGYPERYIELWREALTVTAETISELHVFAARRDDRALGFYALAPHPRHATLEALFVAPEQIGRGIGTLLLCHAGARAASAGCRWLEIASDPNAVGFYHRYGAVQIGTEASLPPGRELPLLSIKLDRPLARRTGT